MTLLTIAEISRNLSVPESTLRYRAKLFGEYLLTKGTGRKKRFMESAVERFAFIDELFNKGLIAEDVRSKLSEKYDTEYEGEVSETKKSNKNSSTPERKKISIDNGETKEIAMPGMTFEIQELLMPMIKVIENQEMIISELRKQNQMLATLPAKQVQKGWIERIFG